MTRGGTRGTARLGRTALPGAAEPGRLPRLFLRFACVGAVGTAAHYLVLLVLVAGTGATAVPASAAGFLAGAAVNYALNYRLTFASTARHARTLPRFMAVALVGFGANAAAMALLVHGAGLHYLTAQLLATLGVLLLGFVLNARWTFGKA